MQNLREIYYSSNLDPIPNPDLLFLSAYPITISNIFSSGKLYYTDVMEMLRDIDPPLGFGKDCPERQAYKRLIRMNMPMDQEGKVK